MCGCSSVVHCLPTTHRLLGSTLRLRKESRSKMKPYLFTDNRTILLKLLLPGKGVLPAWLSVHHVHVWYPAIRRGCWSPWTWSSSCEVAHRCRDSSISPRGEKPVLDCSEVHILKMTQSATRLLHPIITSPK